MARSRRAVVIGAIIAVGVVAVVMIGKAKQTLRVRFADEQTEIFVLMVQQARDASDPMEAAARLKYLQAYYPSGTKQGKGSRLDKIVERSRSLAAGAIITHLEELTGENLGDDPDSWVRAYTR